MSNVNLLVAKNAKAYREAAGYSQSFLAQKAYIPLETVEKTEQGKSFSNKYYYLMKITETLGLAYYDLFEHGDGSTAARNVSIPQEAIDKIFKEMDKKGIAKKAFCKAIGTKSNSVWYWKSGRSVPSPFLFYNACSFLGMNADSFKDVVTETKEVQAHKINAEEKKEEKPVGLGEVIKACNVYQKLDSVINQLDEIIKTATDLKAELEKERA